MKCPFCGKIETGVIDSRLTKERTAIRRRRQCTGCADRFTTYESTPEHFLFLLMQQHTPKGSSIKSPKAMLAFMSNAFKGLSEGIEKLVVKVDKPEAAKVVKKPRRKVAGKAKPKKRAPVRKKIVVPRPKKMTAIDEVLQIIKRHKRAINITKLKNKTGFAGRLNLVLTEMGDLYPCELSNQKIGNVRDHGYEVKKLLDSPGAKKAIDKIEPGACYCSHECYFTTNILFNLRMYPSLASEYLKLKSQQ